ncbi:MAG TPA: PhzF family phenazine biosynthesis protein [Solirubrobacteraceae bacterium]|nr:PhzF family phenazine biosynthesis protein [Solirubrobacteraceae bacterium]
MSPRAYTVVDVFTDSPLQGNPAAIFTDGSGLEAELMQRTARELNLSETVFVLPPREEADAAVRIFTPGSELPFAGHPVLGTAFVLAAKSDAELITLETKAGPVPIRLRRESGQVVYGEMEQPIPTRESFPHEHELLAALGLDNSELPIAAYRNGPVHVYVALPDEAAVAGLRPDLGRLSDLGPGFGINCFAGAGRRFKTRNFSPGLGIAEDPATGSAAGPLALHLARHGRVAYGEQLEIRQGEEIGRPSRLYAQVEGSDGNVTRIAVGGSAAIVAHGEYRLQ